jgi:hypothetical protein
MDEVSTVAFGLFKCGQWIREGVVLLQYIESKQWKEFAKKLTFAAASGKSIRRNARLRIAGPLVVLCVLYLLIAVELGVSAFLIALPALLIVWIGGKHVNVDKLIMH